jgi:hypothetical protein
VADPVLVSPGEASPGEADEVADVLAREDPSAVVLRGAEAREARLRATPATILHVAAPWDGPLRDPALLLTPGDGDDGRLEVSEIPAFPDPPQIAVLAGAATEPAEGADTPASLAIGRAFLAAGTGTVIETIDGARSRPGRTEWLADVHRGLRRGLRPSEAVRQARIRASESGDPARATAAAWAPWTVVGRDLPVVRSDATGTRRPADPGAAGIGWAAAIAFFGVTAELLRRRRASRGNGSAPRGA